VADYPFSEGTGSTTADASGNGNTGIVSGATWTTGRFGKALVFDGFSGFVSIPGAPALNLGAAVTLEAWIFPTALGGSRVIEGQTKTGVASTYFMAARGTEVGFGFFGGGAWREHTTRGVNLPIRAWTHVAAAFSDATDEVRIYVNGTLRLSETEQNSLPFDGDQLRIGMGSSGQGFAGVIDEVRVYGRPLGAAEIQSDMNRVVCTPGAPGAGARGVRRVGRRARMLSRSSFPLAVPVDPAAGVGLEVRAGDGTLLYRIATAGAALRTNTRRTVFQYVGRNPDTQGFDRLVLKTGLRGLTISATALGTGLERVAAASRLTLSVQIGAACPFALDLVCSPGSSVTRCEPAPALGPAVASGRSGPVRLRRTRQRRRAGS